MASAFDQYGYVATLANTIPELKAKLNEALKGHWSPDKFSQELQDTKWWKNSSDSVKQLQILKATKPGEYAQQRSLMVQKARTLASGMGVFLSEGKGGSLGRIVDTALKLGWDDTTLQQHIGGYLTYRGHTFQGQAGGVQQQLRELRGQYGAPANEAWTAAMTRQVLMGTNTIDGIHARLVGAAKSQYPSFAKQLDEGQTMAQIADPYINTIASTLEMAPSDVDLHDPSVQRALTARNDKGEPQPMSLWQVQNMMRQDPRYDHTKQAVSDAYSMINQIGKDWGFSA